MLEQLFNGLVESLFGSDPSGTLQRIGGVVFIIVGGSGMIILGSKAYLHGFVTAKKLDKTFWLLAAGAVLGVVLAGAGVAFFTNVGDTVRNNL